MVIPMRNAIGMVKPGLIIFPPAVGTRERTLTAR